MARVRKDRVAKLNADKSWFLNTGFYPDGVLLKDQFQDEKALRAAWENHKDEFMPLCKDIKKAGVRPWAWWCFESGLFSGKGSLEDQAMQAFYKLGHGLHARRDYLIENNLLEPWEIEELNIKMR